MIIYFSDIVTRMNKVFYLFLFLFIATACSEKVQVPLITKKTTKYARFLSIRDEKNGIYIDIKHPDRKNKEYKFFIKKNSNGKVPDDYIEIQRNNPSFIVFSTTHIAMLGQLNQLKTIKGTCASNLIYTKEIKKNIEDKAIVDFGNESNPSLEKIISIKPTAIIYSGFSAEFSKNKELQKLGIITIPNFDWKESHPLGKAEWLLFFGYLTGTEEAARKHLEIVQEEYNRLKKSVQGLSNCPVVLSGSKMGDFWYAPAGESYMAQLFKDAGANYIYKNTKGTGSLAYSQEKILVDAKKADFWINPGSPSYELVKMSNPKASFLVPFREKKVFCYTKDSNKYWELSAIHPEWVMADLIAIFHPIELKKSNLNFYHTLD